MQRPLYVSFQMLLTAYCAFLPIYARAAEGPTLTTSRYLGQNQMAQSVYHLKRSTDSDETINLLRGTSVCHDLLTEQVTAGLAKTKLPDDLKKTYLELSHKIHGITFIESLGETAESTGDQSPFLKFL